MTIGGFLTLLSYSPERPHYVSRGRWIGMCRWLERNPRAHEEEADRVSELRAGVQMLEQLHRIQPQQIVDKRLPPPRRKRR